jgi:alkylated DNA repair dioxygenase AlkB
MVKYAQKSFISLEDNLFVSYSPKFISKKDANNYFNLFENHLIFASDEESKVTIFGKKVKIPRKQVAFGDNSISYGFSGSNIPANDWNNPKDDKERKVTEALKEIRNKVSLHTGILYNYVLINRYKNGNEYIGFHRDSQKEIRQEFISCISLDANLDFIFKPYNFIPNGEYKELDMTLENGSLVEMRYPTNLYWKHSIPKRTKIKMPRISLTFRKINKN